MLNRYSVPRCRVFSGIGLPGNQFPTRRIRLDLPSGIVYSFGERLLMWEGICSCLRDLLRGSFPSCRIGNLTPNSLSTRKFGIIFLAMFETRFIKVIVIVMAGIRLSNDNSQGSELRS